MKIALFSFLVGFGISVVIAPLIIKLIQKLKGGQPILNYVEAHINKSGTPTMGGIIFIVSTIFTILFLCFTNKLKISSNLLIILFVFFVKDLLFKLV